MPNASRMVLTVRIISRIFLCISRRFFILVREKRAGNPISFRTFVDKPNAEDFCSYEDHVITPLTSESQRETQFNPFFPFFSSVMTGFIIAGCLPLHHILLLDIIRVL